MKLATKLAKEVVCNNFIHGMEPAEGATITFNLPGWARCPEVHQQLRWRLYDNGGASYEALRRRWAELLNVEHRGNDYFVGTAS